MLHFEEAIPGQGGIDFRRYLRQVTAAGVPMIIEHLDGPTAYSEAWQFLTSLAGEMRSMAMSGIEISTTGASSIAVGVEAFRTGARSMPPVRTRLMSARIAAASRGSTRTSSAAR